eukprot:5639544-Pleurochrysis_carterae.AAC.1
MWHRLRACPHDRHKQCDAHWITVDHGMVASTRDGSEHATPSCCSFSRRAPTARDSSRARANRSRAARRDASRADSKGAKSE